MNGDEILHFLRMLEEVGSTNKKKDMLLPVTEDPLFKMVTRWTLDPFITYGIKKLPETTIFGTDVMHVNEFGKVEPSYIPSLMHGLFERTLTGNAASLAVKDTLEKLSDDSGQLLRRILGRSLKCKVTATILNDLVPGYIPSFDCMLAHPYEESRIKKWPVFVEDKLDGVRAVCTVNTKTKTVDFSSRSGKPFTTLEHLNEQMLLLADRASKNHSGLAAMSNGTWIFDGEVVAGQFNKTVGDVRRKSGQATDAEFTIFDCVCLYHWERRTEEAGNQTHRSMFLNTLFKTTSLMQVKPINQGVAPDHATIMAMYHAVRTAGGEGVIVKDPEGSYERKRSHAWMKIKAKETADGVIVALHPGEPGKEFEHTLGAAEIEGTFADGKTFRARVSSGFKLKTGTKDQQRDHIWANQDKIIGRMIEVGYHEITPDGALRHPKFLRYRDDKKQQG